MRAATDPVLTRAMMDLAVPGVLVGHRFITPGDEDALLAPEAPSIASSVVEVRRASGAARIVARSLLARLGHPDFPVVKDAYGAPVWPEGIVGSMAHDNAVAVAAVGTGGNVLAVGIDVEPAAPLPEDMLDLVATPSELKTLANAPLGSKVLFAAKEAVYKAGYPLDGVFLEFHDIEVDLAARTATTRTGRTVALRYCVSSRIVVVALAYP